MNIMENIDMIANNLTPAYTSHPGEILKYELEARGISQRKLAEDMGIRIRILYISIHKVATGDYS